MLKTILRHFEVPFRAKDRKTDPIAEQPLHQQQWVQDEMAKFHSSINSLEHRQCVTCKEAWPTKQGFSLARFECLRCKRDKGNPKLYSQENDMDPGALPLQGLTDIEEMLIARACPIMCVYRKHGGQRGYRGHVLNLPQDIQDFLNRLPRNIVQLPYLIIRRHGTDNTQGLYSQKTESTSGYNVT